MNQLKRRGIEKLETRRLLAAIPVRSVVMSEEVVDSTELAAGTLMGEFVIADGNRLRAFDVVDERAIERAATHSFDEPIVKVAPVGNGELIVTTNSEIWRVTGPDAADRSMLLEKRTGLIGAVELIQSRDSHGESELRVAEDNRIHRYRIFDGRVDGSPWLVVDVPNITHFDVRRPRISGTSVVHASSNGEETIVTV